VILAGQMTASSAAVSQSEPAAFIPLAGRFQARLKELRKARGWSLAKLEAESGIGHSILGRYEKVSEPNPTLEHLVALQQVFDLASLEEFFGEVTYPTGRALLKSTRPG